MILWTIQPKEFYNKLLRDGIVLCDINKSKFVSGEEENLNAYKWISGKMKERVATNESADFLDPVWRHRIRNPERSGGGNN